jgi:hypothetical protein
MAVFDAKPIKKLVSNIDDTCSYVLDDVLIPMWDKVQELQKNKANPSIVNAHLKRMALIWKQCFAIAGRCKYKHNDKLEMILMLEEINGSRPKDKYGQPPFRSPKLRPKKVKAKK